MATGPRFTKDKLAEALKDLTDEERATFLDALGAKPGATNDDLWKDLVGRVEKLEGKPAPAPAPAPKKSFLEKLVSDLGLS